MLALAARFSCLVLISSHPSAFCVPDTPPPPTPFFLPVSKNVADRAWVGAEFFRLSEERQKALLATGNMLFCRTEPKDKQRLVKMLQDMGEVDTGASVWGGGSGFVGCPQWLVFPRVQAEIAPKRC